MSRVCKSLILRSLSLVSAGTARMLVDFGKANLMDKVRQQPGKARQLLEKAKTDGRWIGRPGRIWWRWPSTSRAGAG